MGVKYIEDINDAAMDNWIANLRSGRFEQTNGLLAEKLDSGKVGYCCLGVLGVGCGLKVGEHVGDSGPMGLVVDERTFHYLPPASVIESLNLPERYSWPDDDTSSVRVEAEPGDPQGYISNWAGHEGLISVTTLNDHLGLTFDQIADRLERTFLRPEFKK